MPITKLLLKPIPTNLKDSEVVYEHDSVNGQAARKAVKEAFPSHSIVREWIGEKGEHRVGSLTPLSSSKSKLVSALMTSGGIKELENGATARKNS